VDNERPSAHQSHRFFCDRRTPMRLAPDRTQVIVDTYCGASPPAAALSPARTHSRSIARPLFRALARQNVRGLGPAGPLHHSLAYAIGCRARSVYARHPWHRKVDEGQAGTDPAASDEPAPRSNPRASGAQQADLRPAQPPTVILAVARQRRWLLLDKTDWLIRSSISFVAPSGPRWPEVQLRQPPPPCAPSRAQGRRALCLDME